ncbi:hypothetical protein QA641_09775 [Bradyrhizobium sp. CB1650]|uniref:hypothetical protein n=1 Tax=Bradyrhizobium sp. CB1650 TaxID=3039153 RepID=UPI002435B2E6|nr:hypothetical protein [Bradyrhizobium sp. CB1650]WGD54150.1 hypothetical protein QA641_09775 [Bradyrhizobium sp. CB1650]
MTEASGLVNDQGDIEQASGAALRAERDRTLSRLDADSRQTALRLSEQLRKIARMAPLASLSMAFLLGFLLTRRH